MHAKWIKGSAGVLGTLALAGALVFGPAASSAAADPIKIGLVLPQSGPLSVVGAKIKQGFDTAQAMLGPIMLGGEERAVEFVVEQASGESWDPGLAAAACLKLKQAGVVAISGLGGGEGEGCNSVAGRIQIPIIGMNLTTAGVITDKCTKWFVAFSYSPQMSGRAFQVVAKDKFSDVLTEPWWVVSDAPDWGRDLALALKDAAQLDYKTIDIAPPGTTDWAPFLTKMRASGAPVGMVITSWGDQYLAFIRQAADFGVDQRMRLIAPVGVPEWLLYQPGVADALATWTIPMQWGAIWTYEDNWPMLKEFNEKHFELFGEPPSGQGLYGAGSYFMLWNAINAAGSVEAEAILDKLLTEAVDTPVWERPLSVDLPGRQVALPIFVTQVEKLAEQQYGVEFAHTATKVLTYEETRVSPEELGCAAGGPYGAGD
jgi:branched-chain amino acid transport system substrate-binding protein